MSLRAPRLIRRGANFALRVARRLRVFPFSLVYTALSAGSRRHRLAGSEKRARVGEAKGGVSPLAVLIWLDRIASEHRGRTFDVCLRLPKKAEEANLHDVFSILMATPRLVSLGLYWDEASLADDLPYFQGGRERAAQTVRSTERDDLDPPHGKRRHAFLAAGHDRFVVPVAAAREAQTLLKRQAGCAYAVCFNPPAGTVGLTEAVANAFPDVGFFDFQSFESTPRAAANVVGVGGYGLNLHERMALVSAADAYVGRFDELGAAALIAGRPAALLGDEGAAPPLSHGDTALWIPDPARLPGLAQTVMGFLRRHCAPGAG